MNEVISRMVEYLSGIQVFKAHNLAGEKFQRLEKSFRDLKRESIRTEVSIVPFVLIFQIIVDISFPVLLLIATTKFGVGNIDKKPFNLYYNKYSPYQYFKSFWCSIWSI